MPVPETGYADYRLHEWDGTIGVRESVVLLPPVPSMLHGDVVPAAQAARFARGILRRLVPTHALATDFFAAESIAFRRWPTLTPPSSTPSLTSFFTAVAEAYQRAYPDAPPVPASALQPPVGDVETGVDFDEVIGATATRLNVQIRVVEHGIERRFPKDWEGGRVISVYRSWCHYYSTKPDPLTSTSAHSFS